jgi:hypothetical protein
MTTSGLQIRAARGFLDWERRDLAREAFVPLFSIERLENGQMPTGELATALAAIQATPAAKGIEFSDEHGVLSVKLKSK